MPAEKQLGYGWLDQLHPDDRERCINRWKETAGKGIPFDIQFRIRRHDGQYRWFQTRAEAIHDNEGRIARWFGTNADIDDIKRAEAAMAWHSSVVESSIDAIVGLSLEGLITSWNPAAEKLFGFSPVEVIGTSIERLLPAGDVPEWSRHLDSLTSGSSEHIPRAVRLAKNGRRIHVSITLSPVSDEFGRTAGIAKIFRDVSSEIRAENALQAAHHILEDTVAARTEQLRVANEELKGSKQLLDEAQDLSKLGSWSLNVATGEVQWTQALFRIVGLDPQTSAPRYQDQEKMFTPESWSRLVGAINEAVADGTGYELELEVIRPDGTHRWAVARATAGRGADGEIRRITGTFQDVTEARQSRETLKLAALRTHLAAKAAAIGVWDWDITAGELSWDETMRGHYDWLGEVNYDVWRDSVVPEDRQAAEQAVEDALEGRKAFDTIFRIRTRQGAERHIHAMAQVVRDNQGRPIRMVGVNRDVTAERLAELRLKESEALLKEFVRYAPACIAMFDTDMRYLQASEQWISDYKLQGVEVLGRSHYEVFPDIPERWKSIHRRVLGGAVERCDEDPFPRADGGLEWLQWEVRPWLRGDGAIGGLIMFTQVITAKKQMEIELRRRQEELNRSNRDLEHFAYAASHDLQEPLRAITGCLQILRRRHTPLLTPDAIDLVTHAVDGADRMRQLIADLLSYSRVRADIAGNERTSLEAGLRDALKNLSGLIEQSGTGIVFTQPLPELPLAKTPLVQLLQNIIGNAIKYRAASRKPEVTISAVERDAEIEVSIADNGIGMESQYLERIFVIFQRLHGRADYPGTGIGLAICKKIVENAGGRIWAESIPAEGSTFRFVLPRNQFPTFSTP